MAEPNTHSDPVNVEQIMQRIRARIREKRGADYTEQQLRELTAAKLEGFLGPRNVHSGILDQLRHGGSSPLENYAFDDASFFGSRRGPLGWIRRLLRPLLGLFFDPTELVHDLQLQAGINARHEQFNELSYELIGNLVLETTRLEIEVKKLEMRLESQSSRFDFAERRARALEGAVRSRPERAPETDGGQRRAAREQAEPVQAASPAQPAAPRDAESGGSAEARRRRRRRRGRRGGTSRAPGEAVQGGGDQVPGGAEPSGGAGSEPGADTGRDSTQRPADLNPPEPPEHDDQ